LLNGAVLGVMSRLIAAEAVPEGTTIHLLSKMVLSPLGVVYDGAVVAGVMLIRFM
jgi:hypothetical protein